MGTKIFLVLLAIVPTMVMGKNYFTAAVFEHRPRDDGLEDPKDIVTSNLQYYEKAVALAAEKGADIILFNEFGLFPYVADRSKIRKFMEYIVDPEKEKFNPCLNKTDNLLILPALSCMARKNNIYVVANMGDIQPCEGTCDAKEIQSCTQRCPEDGVFMYNTAIAFDREGNIIARYHKMHPYFENLNVPEEPEYITFKTSFGTFGLIICFDSVFIDSMILARDHKIDTLLFPTFWFDDILPFNAVEWQQSWAVSNRVNFIAANTQTAGNASLGSGIYSKYYGALVYTYEPDGESKLLISNVPFKKTSDFTSDSSIIVIKQDSTHVKTETGDKFPEQCYDKLVGPENDHYADYRCFKHQTENYTLTKLQTVSGSIDACNNGFCCKLTYVTNNIKEDYYLAAFSGLNNVHNYFHWCEETCLLVRCDAFDNKPCVMQPSRSNTVFKSLKMSAEFTSERVYPTVTKSNFRLASKKEWKYERKGSRHSLSFKTDNVIPLLKVGLLGRCYERDPPFVPWYKY